LDQKCSMSSIYFGANFQILFTGSESTKIVFI